MKSKILNLLMILLMTILLLSGCTNSDGYNNTENQTQSNQSNIETEADDNNNENSSNEDDKTNSQNSNANSTGITIKENGRYSSLEEVAKYIHEYDKLPSNFITKKEAEQLGWKSDEGNLWDVTDQMSIGGDYFGNREKKLPSKSGRKYFECDINYTGGFRGAERIVYSNDGLVYYTDDHYETFTQLYSKEGAL